MKYSTQIRCDRCEATVNYNMPRDNKNLPPRWKAVERNIEGQWVNIFLCPSCDYAAELYTIDDRIAELDMELKTLKEKKAEIEKKGRRN